MMEKKKMVTDALCLLLAFTGSFCVGYGGMALVSPQQAQAPAPQETESLPTDSQREYYTTVTREVYYRGCRHFINDQVDVSSLYPGKDKAALLAMGWVIDDSDPEQVVICRDEDGLCPEDQKYRHIIATQEGIAVYSGPIGTAGQQLSVIEMDLSLLPADWQAALSGKGLEFEDEDALYSALDSIEEYQYSYN